MYNTRQPQGSILASGDYDGEEVFRQPGGHAIIIISIVIIKLKQTFHCVWWGGGCGCGALIACVSDCVYTCFRLHYLLLPSTINDPVNSASNRPRAF